MENQLGWFSAGQKIMIDTDNLLNLSLGSYSSTALYRSKGGQPRFEGKVNSVTSWGYSSKVTLQNRDEKYCCSDRKHSVLHLYFISPYLSLFLLRCEIFFPGSQVFHLYNVVLDLIITKFLLAVVGLYDTIIFLFKRFILKVKLDFCHFFFSVGILSDFPS